VASSHRVQDEFPCEKNSTSLQLKLELKLKLKQREEFNITISKTGREGENIFGGKDIIGS